MIFVVLEELCMHKNRNMEYRHVFYISLVYQLLDKVSELFLLHDFLGNYFQMFLSEFQILRQVSGINYLIKMSTYCLPCGDSEITWVE